MVYRSMSSKELAGGCKARSGSDPWRGATLSVCVARFGASLLLSHKTKMHYTHYSMAHKAKTKASMREAELKSTHSICAVTMSEVLANSRKDQCSSTLNVWPDLGPVHHNFKTPRGKALHGIPLGNI